MDTDPVTAPELQIIVEAGDNDGELGAGVKRKRRLAPCGNCRYVSIALNPLRRDIDSCAQRSISNATILPRSVQDAQRTASGAFEQLIASDSGMGLVQNTTPRASPSVRSGWDKVNHLLKYIDETAEIAAIYGQEEEDSDVGHQRHEDDGDDDDDDDDDDDEGDEEHDQQKETQRGVEQSPQDGQQNQQDLEEDRASQPLSGEANTSQNDNDATPKHSGDHPPIGSQHSSAALSLTSDPTSLPSNSLHGISQLGNTLWQSPLQDEQSSPVPSRQPRGFSTSQTSVPFYSPNQSGRVTDTSAQNSFLSGLVKRPSNTAAQTANSELEVTLVRYFIDVLACWFDLCDPEKHFALIVPHRARWCPPLKNAILAASARHLTRVCNPTSKPDFVYFYDGRVVPHLTEEIALHYHSECIKDLVQRSMNMEQTKDANLLAAAIILRFYEEVDAPLREDRSDNELFLRVINVFIDAQIPAAPGVPHSSPVITGPKIAPDQYGLLIYSSKTAHSPTGSSHTPSLNEVPPHWRTDGLRQAGYWVAFRQEIHAVFLKQRPFNLSLSRCEAFRSFAPAEDAVWADRLVVFCADVLEFCYNGDTKDNASQQEPNNQTLKDRWLRLKQQEKMWREVLPASFEPIFFRDPDRFEGEVFPHICYMIDCHIVGVQYVDLARILLAIYDPRRPKLGPGYNASMRALAAEVRAAVLRLCGIAMSNRKCPPAFVTAYLGVAMCGDYFEDPLEQEALLGLLDEMESVHAWPAGDTRQALKDAWGKA